MTRHAPAKKRRRSTTTGISSIAAPTGLPAFWLDSSRPSSSAFAPRATSAILSSARLRSCGRRVLPRLEGGRRRVDGAVDVLRPRRRDVGDDLVRRPGSRRRASRPRRRRPTAPPMNCWYVLTRSRVSVTGASTGTLLANPTAGRDASADCAPPARSVPAGRTPRDEVRGRPRAAVARGPSRPAMGSAASGSRRPVHPRASQARNRRRRRASAGSPTPPRRNAGLGGPRRSREPGARSFDRWIGPQGPGRRTT